MSIESNKKMRLAVLTSGGDSAGMNAAVRAVVKAGIIKYSHLLIDSQPFPDVDKEAARHTLSEKAMKVLLEEIAVRLSTRPR